MNGPRERQYIVREYVEAWSEWTVTATSKREAIEKVKDGDYDDEGFSGNSGPNGRYEVERLE